MKRRMCEMTGGEKILLVLQIVVSAVVLLISLLVVLDVWDSGLRLAVPLLGALQLISGFREWKHRKAMAVISFSVAAFVFACSAAVLCL